MAPSIRIAADLFRRDQTRLGWLSMLVFTLVVASSGGCGENADSGKTLTDAAASEDAATDAAETDQSAESDTPSDAATDTGPATPADKPLASVDAPAWVTPTGWVASPYGGGADQVGPALAGGTFKLPAPGDKAYGHTWQDASPKSGQSGPFGNKGSLHWLIARINTPQATAALARLDRVINVRANGWRAPGDIYGHGKARVPLRLIKGDNIVAMLVSGGQKIRAHFETSAAELHLNRHDWTRPELREGYDDTEWLGLPLLELTGTGQGGIRCRVMASDHWQGTEVLLPGIGQLAVTHASFKLHPKKAWSGTTKETEKRVPVTLRVESLDSKYAYEHSLELDIVGKDDRFRQTFRSPVDLSTQFYGVVPPSNFDPKASYGVALSLHGAGVEGKGQANSYSPKDWLYVIAATNRRRFGFDWEEWGHLNGLASLAHATERFGLDPLRTYVTGHSMGGHGTWQFGVHHAGMFAVVGPSAGWDSFYTYGNAKKPTGPTARARAHSDTSRFLSNLTNRSVYVIHGMADKVVPWSEGQAMRNKSAQYSQDVQHHWQPGAGHWWNGQKSKGTDCVDWPALFDLMKQRKLDPVELNFTFTTPGPWYSDSYSFVRILSAASPNFDSKVTSAFNGAELVVTTSQVRSLQLDTAALATKGLPSVTVDGKVYPLKGKEPIIIGPTTGKRPGVHGPFNQVMHTPWCWVHNDGAAAYAAYASYLSTTWALIGNGQACTLPASRLTPAISKNYNLIHLGRTPEQAGAPKSISWTSKSVTLGAKTFPDAAMQVIWDAGDRLAAAVVAPDGKEGLLWSAQPFSSRAGRPDFMVWGVNGMMATGNFDAEWQVDPSLAQGL
ncbi:MAG: prolyl oligopeptidase family serine peptidase [Myxococcales bacterium]|nr:prolyl oligopeptidase family serine peptidase [Myxococcales bacterium]